ncbi:MAG: hypothetical protein A3A96_00395 [Candidatus Zambryskibacteria bacterium RIFCSPLOWO2_01_FULL_39_39]|uniref:NfeD-like C-terminal domain-containing protein n=1 Tax=Candidatus Zambryskibacteria bacterium RIFCSPLOWO2_01_FULL_39_39 TaxID=1802758 RepID=A0A1G2TX53_9BACT|nr:MAG: hypothetical protein UT00_C0001G0023 [Parcubacteria group bacterium GW2011_GWA1_38_7]OHA87833.1 MAG: hypothetical protein A2644_01500 [Candidatus Zambryskibacteria bacterium RIFCSPHIGHO2_01_FULL_39_63]OHA94943.1 MAG: hypothetical protein A3B88_01015 [Candidatus Zambryskibacteria bacterium RIFCSPHIGHO2_02_FULL_39_19]OHA99123.1 MAG: hypothetical protein A3F20_02965 [Candidatus Zambryskibacteria bacterium RIFCSPHIGHO2_12_FULL_39_21]OHB01885.1 MAG: hypothetical protein A3A96_00395 [Candidat
MPLFLVTGIFGLLFFVGSLLLGDHDVGHDHDFDGDHDHEGPNIFSVFNVAWFLIGFGGMGAIMRANSISMPGSTISGLLTGVVCWGFAFFVMHMLKKQQGDSTVTTARLMQATGVVVLQIPVNGIGKIQCSVAGGSQEFLARYAGVTSLPEGSRVRIVGDNGGVYTVETL